MKTAMLDWEFFRGKRVFLTGHTGFKGAWLSKILQMAGAQVTGYALIPHTQPNLFEQAALSQGMRSVVGDIRDFEALWKAFTESDPEIVIHMAAQPLVLTGYQQPVYTYETNVMGTVHILECVRRSGTVRSFLNITTDKVYLNREWPWGYRENDPLDGFDPYSNSKSCSELVTHSYKNSFFQQGNCAISTARAGNVIGGGDYAENRIIPDCVRAALENHSISLRNPHSIRPYQHVLEPLFAYLLLAQRQWEEKEVAGCYNIGPKDEDCVDTGTLASLFCRNWQEGLQWENKAVEGPHEAAFLKLDCSLIEQKLGWRPMWNIGRAVEETVFFAKALRDGTPAADIMKMQIKQYLKEKREIADV